MQAVPVTGVQGISIHALREEGDEQPQTAPEPQQISIHALREEGDLLRGESAGKVGLISIHALREEGDQMRRRVMCGTSPFLSTPSARRATGCCHAAGCRGRISIHALREEGDCFALNQSICSILFLSTPSARRATTTAMSRKETIPYFYPRPPRGGRLGKKEDELFPVLFLSTPSARRATPTIQRSRCVTAISIHALREEGDVCYVLYYNLQRISIHALREEGDKAGEPVTIPLSDFYPRPPRGGRHMADRSRRKRKAFLSTPSARRATLKFG